MTDYRCRGCGASIPVQSGACEECAWLDALVIITPAEWWAVSDAWGERGRVDGVLCLLAQGEISRAKARELISVAVGMLDVPLPAAPWDALRWGEPLPVVDTCGACGRLGAVYSDGLCSDCSLDGPEAGDEHDYDDEPEEA